jgi:hypothetical protein
MRKWERHNTMNVIITMAGTGSRFVKAGYTTPKYAIHVLGHTLFAWALISLRHYWQMPTTHVIFVAQQEHDVGPFLTKACLELGIERWRLVTVPVVTDGQATTAMAAIPLIDQHAPLCIYNIDTFVEPTYLESWPAHDGYIPCFQGTGNHWSFVALDNNGYAVNVAEKKRISPFATIGLYGFKNAMVFSDAYQHFQDTTHQERYIAPLYQYLIDKNYKIVIKDIPLEGVHALGTPEEVRIFEHSYVRPFPIA